MNPLKKLSQHGLSIWLDYIDRRLLASGGLARLIAEDDVRGVTSNPAIFEKAIGGDPGYREALAALRRKDLPPAQVLEQLMLPDIGAAAEALRGVYTDMERRDGYVSLEVPPSLAHDTGATVAEARRLWLAVGRDNLMIKVPATEAGLPAITQLIADGINVNVTLLFSQAMHMRVMDAYLTGLEQRAAAGLPLDGIASVASFFVSRIDTEVDERLGARLTAADNAGEREAIRALMGKAAIANAKLAYQRWKTLLAGPRWQALSKRGARAQRLLWASTGVKNPAYRDVLYIEELIGPDTVNTVPPATLDAFRDHGRVRLSLEEDVDEAKAVIDSLEGLGISLDQVTDQLLNKGVALFAQAYDKMLARLTR